MGIVEFFFLVVVVCILAFLADKVIAYVAPERPAIVTKIIWGVALLIIIVTLINVLGLFDYDPKIPRLRPKS